MRHTLIAVLLASLATAGGALGFGTDNRQAMPSSLNMPWQCGQIDSLDGVWRALGRVINKEGRATGCLVGPNLVLTAKHVVFDDRTGKDYPGLEFITALPGPRGKVEHSTIKGAFHQGQRTTKAGQSDWILVQLDHSLGNVFGFLGCKTFDPGEDPLSFPVTFYGFANNPNDKRSEFKQQQTAYSSAGKFVMKLPPDQLIHDCASWPGGAGAPLVVMSHDKPWVAGVHISGLAESKLPPEWGKRCQGGFLQGPLPDQKFQAKYGNRCVALNQTEESVNQEMSEMVPTPYKLTIWNQYRGTIQVAVRFHSDNFDEDKLSGYVSIPAGQQMSVIGQRDGLTKNEVYLHAHADDGKSWPPAEGAAARWSVAGESEQRPFVKLLLDSTNSTKVVQ